MPKQERKDRRLAKKAERLGRKAEKLERKSKTALTRPFSHPLYGNAGKKKRQTKRAANVKARAAKATAKISKPKISTGR